MMSLTLQLMRPLQSQHPPCLNSLLTTHSHQSQHPPCLNSLLTTHSHQSQHPPCLNSLLTTHSHQSQHPPCLNSLLTVHSHQIPHLKRTSLQRTVHHFHNTMAVKNSLSVIQVYSNYITTCMFVIDDLHMYTKCCMLYITYLTENYHQKMKKWIYTIEPIRDSTVQVSRVPLGAPTMVELPAPSV